MKNRPCRGLNMAIRTEGTPFGISAAVLPAVPRVSEASSCIREKRGRKSCLRVCCRADLFLRRAFGRLPIFLPAPSFGKGGAGSLVSGRRETKISNLSDCLFLCQWRIRFVNLYSENPYYQGDKYVKSRVVTPQ